MTQLLDQSHHIGFKWQSRLPDPNWCNPMSVFWIVILFGLHTVVQEETPALHILGLYNLKYLEERMFSCDNGHHNLLKIFNCDYDSVCHTDLYCSYTFYNNFMIVSWVLATVQIYPLLHLNCLLTLMRKYYYPHFIREEIET